MNTLDLKKNYLKYVKEFSEGFLMCLAYKTTQICGVNTMLMTGFSSYEVI